MLDKLFGSQTRVKLLKLFLLSPDRRLTLAEAAKLAKGQILPLKKELDNLERFGLLTSFLAAPEAEADDSKPDKGNGNGKEQKYYQLNPEFVLKDELKALLIKAQVLYERDFIDKLMKLGRVKLLVLTGMFVNLPDSPIDLLVVGHLNKKRLVELLTELEAELGKEINFTFMDPADFVYRRSMTDVFLYQVLEGKRIILVDEFGI